MSEADDFVLESADAWFPVVYDELRRLAAARLAREKPSYTLQPTSLVHEAYLRLADGSGKFESRRHFFGAASKAMDRILADRARAKTALKRGGKARARLAIDVDFLPDDDSHAELIIAMSDALAVLETLDPLAAEIARERYFLGMTVKEIAAELGISETTVHDHWRFAKAWLGRELSVE